MGSSFFVTLLHLTTAAIQIGMNLSPAPDLYKVNKFKTTGQLALLPLVLMCFNNHLWLLYGLLTGSYFPLSAAALVGEFAGVVFTGVYYRWARNVLEARRTCCAAFGGVTLVTLYVLLSVSGRTGQSHAELVQTLGYIGATINICMYASPLATIKLVLETKSSASLPINLSCMIFLNCCMWVATSMVDNDMFVLIPSAIGLLCSFVQLLLYFIYRPTHPYIDIDVQLQEGYATSIDSVKCELDTTSTLPTTYRTVRPSRVARFATYTFQRAEGASLTAGGLSPLPRADTSPIPTPTALHYSPIADGLSDLESQPLIMTPIAA
ncbi:hypothetical protein PHYBOEH_007211 [Phytophthora boehmeriae]|uniref:Sugar transporter SWEET1 n=1 Tax=Phytophthora boehmeriae TaxID=109152 RepID=A0A8T1W917_9STRA|nr:hypothetical protein PHYBOEH_007211 [Phytophthora boehmeriae]